MQKIYAQYADYERKLPSDNYTKCVGYECNCTQRSILSVRISIQKSSLMLVSAKPQTLTRTISTRKPSCSLKKKSTFLTLKLQRMPKPERRKLQMEIKGLCFICKDYNSLLSF